MPNNAAYLQATVPDDSRYVEKEGVGIFISQSLADEPLLTHGFTTRIGGVSAPPFDSLNLGTGRDEPFENIIANYKKLCSAYGLRFDELALVRHEHGANILKLTAADGGRGVGLPPLDFSDGFVTNDPKVTLMTCHADCSAFFIYDKKTRSIGLAHAGWKGMFKRIGQRLVERLAAEYGADPSDMLAVIGPCICSDCFEVELELAESFAEEFDCPDIYKVGGAKYNGPFRQDKACVSLHAAAIIQLADAGVPIKNIRRMASCTREREQYFYSYRRDGIRTGSMCAFLRLDDRPDL